MRVQEFPGTVFCRFMFGGKMLNSVTYNYA